MTQYKSVEARNDVKMNRKKMIRERSEPEKLGTDE